MGDQITILKHPKSLLAKTWKADGEITAYDDAKHFVPVQRDVESIRELSVLLAELEGNQRACVIRGIYRGAEHAAAADPEHQEGRARRVADLYDDMVHHWALIEIDNFEPLCADPVSQPVEAIDEFIATCLPECFVGMSYHWQLSNSAGAPKHVGKLKAHVWFWLETAQNSETLRAWAKTSAPAIDPSVFNVVQIHYTASPVFEEGVTDPVPVRSGFIEGFLGDAVPLEIDASMVVSAGGAKQSRHQRLQEVTSTDPVAQRLAELGMVKSQGKRGELFIECPLAENHSQDSGPTSTAYYPAHTGGYVSGAFVCQHAHCRDTPQSIFLEKLGIDPVADDFAVVEPGGSAGGVGTLAGRMSEARHQTTDQANAVRIVKRYGRRLMVSADRWYAWVGTHWASDSAAVHRFALNLSKIIHGEADRLRAEKTNDLDKLEKNQKIADALEAWAKKSEMKNTIDAAMALAKRMLMIDSLELDANPWALNCANGTVDLRTGELREHNPDDFITKLVPYDYKPDAQAPEFLKVLAAVTCEQDQAQKPLAAFLQRWYGYCCTGSVREQKFAVHYGGGRNGKSTILGMVGKILKDYAGTAAPGLLLSKGNNNHPTELADLAGRRMMTAHESSDGGVLREEFVKQATGGDMIKARFMRGDFFEFSPTHKLQLLTNYKPVIKGQDAGIWGRVMLIPYGASWGTAEEVASGLRKYVKDPAIEERLDKEREGILAWLVAGARAWYRDGLNPPDVVLTASKEYQSGQDRVWRFAQEECEVGIDFEEKVSTPSGGGLYPAYTNWCKQGGIFPLSKERFLADLERCIPYFVKKDKYEKPEGAKRRRFVVVQGLRLTDDEL